MGLDEGLEKVNLSTHYSLYRNDVSKCWFLHCNMLFGQDKIHSVLINSRSAINMAIITKQKLYDIYTGSGWRCASKSKDNTVYCWIDSVLLIQDVVQCTFTLNIITINHIKLIQWLSFLMQNAKSFGLNFVGLRFIVYTFLCRMQWVNGKNNCTYHNQKINENKIPMCTPVGMMLCFLFTHQ